MPPGCCGSKEDSGERITRNTNVSVNEESRDSIQLTYDVRGASSSGCSFQWKPFEGGYKGKMTAVDGSTIYTHEFPNPVPPEIVNRLGKPTHSKSGKYVIFTFKRDRPDISLQSYVRN